MKLVCFNNKGGVGKTTTAFNLHKTFNLNLFTNDKYNILYRNKLAKLFEYKYTPEAGVYDLGGFNDNIANLISKSDLVILPTFTNDVDLQATLLTLKEIAPYNKNIVLIFVKEKEANIIKKHKSTLDLINKLNPNTKIAYIRDSKNMSKTITHNKSIEELKTADKFGGFGFKGIIEDYTKLIEIINKQINNK